MKFQQLLVNILIKNKNIQTLFQASTGKGFEERVKAFLTDDSSYIIIPNSRLGLHESFKELKSTIQDMGDNNKINGKIENKYIKDISSGRKILFHQPFGSQQYPDFLLVSDEYIIPLEIKYSTLAGNRPVWNSGLPRMSGFYIFGSFLKKDITFFYGDSLITSSERKILIGIFNSTEEFLKKELGIKNEMLSGNFGLYLRRMYNQKIDLLNNTKRKKIENETIKLAQSLEA